MSLLLENSNSKFWELYFMWFQAGVSLVSQITYIIAFCGLIRYVWKPLLGFGMSLHCRDYELCIMINSVCWLLWLISDQYTIFCTPL